ncbi:uncharacterized protein LOC134821535 [Bolinopsis microptera]|uniref:uncharacterized protein LOC134821535 n=1 Tax=Bolinopsis microptera TaxID=2820187 RepID=UPI00307A9E7C
MGSGEILPGDWTCESCEVNNFARRTHCIDCQKPKDDIKDGVIESKEEKSVDVVIEKEAGVKEELEELEELVKTEEKMEDKIEEKIEEAVPDAEDKVGSREVRDGDWTCSSCKANNFARRQSCFKCKAHKDGTAGESDKFEFRNGDWSCSTCGTHNFARRSACFQCRKQRPEGNDWICMNCNMNNFARRAYCFGCQAPKYASDHRDSNHYHGSSPYYNNGPPNHGPPNHGPPNHGPPNDGYYSRGPPPPPRGGAMGRNPVRNGDWMCAGCNFHNFARRETCKGCGEHKGENEVVQDKRQGVQPGDWACDSCGENNWARRTKCYKCEDPKPLLED